MNGFEGLVVSSCIPLSYPDLIEDTNFATVHKSYLQHNLDVTYLCIDVLILYSDRIKLYVVK